MEEPFPPGTSIEKLDPASNTMKSSTMMDIPLGPTQPRDKQVYIIQFDDGTSLSLSVPYQYMSTLIPWVPIPLASLVEASDILLPPSLLSVETEDYIQGGWPVLQGLHEPTTWHPLFQF